MATRARQDLDHSTRGAVADITVAFAGVLLLVTSGMQILQGLAAIANGDIYAAGSDYLYQFDMTTWGIIQLVLGGLGVVVAIGILMRASWAQVVGMVIAGLSALTNFAFLPQYPFGAIVLIAANILVIWALSVQLRNYRH